MCLVLLKPATAKVDVEKHLEGVYDGNDDGFGAMWLEDGAVRFVKAVPKNFDDVLKLWYDNKLDEKDVGVHFRFRTHGKVDDEHCHPYKILGAAEDGRDLYLMHNGVLSPWSNRAKGDESDTELMIREVLRPLAVKYGDLLMQDIMVPMLEKTIGSGNKFLLLDSKLGFKVINKEQGDDKKLEGCWVSNVYTFRTAWKRATGGAAGSNRRPYSENPYTMDGDGDGYVYGARGSDDASTSYETRGSLPVVNAGFLERVQNWGDRIVASTKPDTATEDSSKETATPNQEGEAGNAGANVGQTPEELQETLKHCQAFVDAQMRNGEGGNGTDIQKLLPPWKDGDEEEDWDDPTSPESKIIDKIMYLMQVDLLGDNNLDELSKMSVNNLMSLVVQYPDDAAILLSDLFWLYNQGELFNVPLTD